MRWLFSGFGHQCSSMRNPAMFHKGDDFAVNLPVVCESP
jgi:hypothetical protein